METTLAVDLGGSHMRCAVVGADGAMLERHSRPTPHNGTGPQALVDLMLSAQMRVRCATAVVGVPGRVNYEDGILEHAPNLPPGWVDIIGERYFAEGLGIPVALANDADLAAVGEAWFGAGRGYRDVAYVTFSTGVGAGVVLARRLLHGRRSLVEIGHSIIDRPGAVPATLEQLASGATLAKAAEAAGLVDPAVGASAAVVAAVAKGDARAQAIWDTVAQAAATGVVNLAWVFTPEVIVVGGGLGLIGDPLLTPIRAMLATSGPPALDTPIVVVGAALGDDAGLIGAAAWEEAFVPESAARPRAGG